MSVVLAVRDVVKSFGAVRAVDGVSFSVRRGTITGLLGRNGAGKTTTIRMITGIFLPDSGVIEGAGGGGGGGGGQRENRKVAGEVRARGEERRQSRGTLEGQPAEGPAHRHPPARPRAHHPRRAEIGRAR